MRFCHFDRNRKTQDENDGQPKVTEKQDQPGINRPVTVTQYHFYAITVVENNKKIMKITVQGELNIYFSFHGKKFCKLTPHDYYGSHDSR